MKAKLEQRSSWLDFSKDTKNGANSKLPPFVQHTSLYKV